mmetsp:Transcript_46941/g.69472  ORF Transcript_46941/g.69472 Transcript_46941/m.69472 type:complete len:364 (-) Transcript_46941:114-1205(-)
MCCALDVHELLVTEGDFRNFGSSTQSCRIDGFGTLQICQIGQDGSTASSRNTVQVAHRNTAETHDVVLHKVLCIQVVDASGRENHVSTCVDQLHDAVTSDVFFLFLDLFHLVHVFDKNLNTLLETELAEVETEDGNLGILHRQRHTLCRTHHLKGKSVNQVTLGGALSWALDDVDIVDEVLLATIRHSLLNGKRSIDHQLREEVVVRTDNLRGHGRFGSVDDNFLAQRRDVHHHVRLDKLDSFASCQPNARNHRGWVNFLLHEFVSTLQQFGSKKHDRRGSITNFFVLAVRQLDQNLGCGVVHLQLLEDGGSVVGDCGVANLVHEHFVQTNRAEGRAHNVGNGNTGSHVLRANVLAAHAVSVK